MTVEIDVLFGPVEFAALPARDLRDTAAVVFDVLRATSTAVTALANGARAIRPVATVEEAVEAWRREVGLLLAGERGGRRIGAEQSGGVEFDFGNSPREFAPERVAGRTLVMTTTNGTRALRACAGAGLVLAGSFLNLRAAVARVRAAGLSRVLLVGSGTGEVPALEDTLACGAFAEAFGEGGEGGGGLTDAARVAVGAWRAAAADLPSAVAEARNARRLLAMPDLAPDVAECLRREVTDCVPVLVGGRELVRGG
jgi:2-phosphosulfolactate phosphatase